MVAASSRIFSAQSAQGQKVIVTTSDLVSSGLLPREALSDDGAIAGIRQGLADGTLGESARADLLKAASQRRGVNVQDLPPKFSGTPPAIALDARQQRKIEMAPKVKKAAGIIVDEIDKVPMSRPDMKRFDIRIGKGDAQYNESAYLYGRERKFLANGSTGNGSNGEMGLMIQSLHFKKSAQGLGLFDEVAKEYQARYPKRGIFVESVQNDAFAKKLERPNNKWQKAPNWDESARNYWLPPALVNRSTAP